MPRNPFDPALDSRRIELGLGDRGRRRPRAARARHRHRRLRPRAGRAEQHRRPQAEPRPGLRPRAWCRPAARSIASRCSRSPSTMPWPRSRPSPAPIPPTRTRARVRSARPALCLRACGSACRCRASACSSATRPRPRPTTRRSRVWPALGATIVEIDIEPFYETARLLYDGPWVAERYLDRALADRVGAGSDASRDARQIILAGARPSAADAFAAFYELEQLRRVARPHVSRDRRAAVADGADGLHRRAGAGRSGRAQQPARHLHQFRQPARPLRPRRAGVDARRRHAVRHHAARAGRQRRARSPASAACSTPTPACRSARPASRSRRLRRLPPRAAAGEIAVAVVGAHLSGMPLNGELQARSAHASSSAPRPRRTIACSCCRAIRRRSPACCGSARTAAPPSRSRSGRCRREAFGRFVAAIPPPLVDRHARARRRPRREGLPGGGRGDRRAPATSPPSAAGAPSSPARNCGRETRRGPRP